ncbi:hypothetical protein BGX31_004711 [Mortierella sp. GBA43]|nr:hypothetical protein BGX31_004711 [Mortierella sp. GBA43]
MQEPASVLFSLLNGYMHLRAWPKLKRAIPQDYYMRPFYLAYALVGMNTWLWSAVYHSRDWPSTEKLDYFSAGASIIYLTFVKFDYGYNMAATSAIGAIHNLCWIGWSITHWRERPYAWQPTICGALITAAMCLEILDFAPLWGVLDAHSLWHAATILLIPYWYQFLLKDTDWEVRNRKGVLRPHRD